MNQIASEVTVQGTLTARGRLDPLLDGEVIRCDDLLPIVV
jgi:hypothetical protein